MIITIKLRLRDKHSAELNRQGRAVNFVWNFCNETQRHALKWSKRWPSGFDLGKLAAGSSRELDISSRTVDAVCHQYAKSRKAHNRAWLNWRGQNSLGWIPFHSDGISFDCARVKFRNSFFEPMHLRPELTDQTKFGCGSFNQDSKGCWYVNFPVEIEEPAPFVADAVGIDLGLKSLATLSDGQKIEAPRFFRIHETILATSQRGRKTKRTAAIHRKICNRRKDFIHKASNHIAKNFGLIVVGDVSSTKLAKTRMAKSVYDAGWSDFKSKLSYKAIRHGGKFIEVNEAWTSQTCSECGSKPASRPKGIAGLGIREWRCDDCGAVHDRDVNAARNILRLGLETLAEGAPKAGRSQKGAVE